MYEVEQLEKLVIGHYAGHTLLSHPVTREPVLSIPDHTNGLAEMYHLHMEKRAQSVGSDKDKISYEAWLWNLPYFFAQRETRQHLREIVKDNIQIMMESYGPEWREHSHIVMSDHKQRIKHPKSIGLDILIRWPFSYATSTGMNHNLNVPTNSVVITVHGLFNEFPHTSGMKSESIVRWACIHEQFLENWINELWDFRKERESVSSLTSGDYSKSVQLFYEIISSITKKYFYEEKI